MYPSASETRGRGPSGEGPRAGGRAEGLTILEVIVALVVASILLWGVTRFFKDSSRTYDMQAMMVERDQNAHFTINHLTEALQQSGASLPDTGFPIITPSGPNPSSSITLGRNPKGGIYFISSAAPAALTKVPVSDTSLFSEATHVLVDYVHPARATVKRSITGRKNGPATGLDTLFIGPALPFMLSLGDIVYAYKEDVYALSGGHLTLDGQVLAENIDSLRFHFFDAAKAPAAAWAAMRSARIEVTARTARPDPKLPGDGFRRLSLSMTIFLRGRV